MATIHHNTLKKAAVHGITLNSNGNGTQFQATRTNDAHRNSVLATAADPKDALDLAIQVLKDSGDTIESTKPKKATRKAKSRDPVDEDFTEDGEDEEGGDKSVVKSKYKAKYQPHKGTCGDAMVNKLRDYTTVVILGKVQPGGKRTKEQTISVDKMEKLGRANDVWNPAWRQLRDRTGNVAVGMIRMNLGNRLRGLARRKVEIKWPS